MVVRKKNTRGRRKIGRKSPVTRRNAVRTPRAKAYTADALDGAIVIGSQMTAQIEESTNMQIVASLVSAIYGGAVTGLMLQGESDPQTIARRAGEIVTAARAQMQKETAARETSAKVTFTGTEAIPVSDILTGAYDPNTNDPPNTTDNTDRA